MNEERFSESDLLPSKEERMAGVAHWLDRSFASVAVIAVGVAIGGMLALGACAAPFVFSLTPAPDNGTAMGAAFARFDRIALTCSMLLLAAEVVRTVVAWGTPRTMAPRLRRVFGVLFAACTAYSGLALTPTINDLHRAGVVRSEGDDGARLDAIHKRAELVGKAELAVGVILVALHVFTTRRAGEDEGQFAAPLPPGPVA